MAKLRTDQSLDANLVEEVLRYNSPVHFTRRITTEDMTIAGTDIAAGSVLLLRAASANRDPRKWGPMADRFLIDSEGANDQLSFGGGRHFCVGAALARLEGQIALPQLVRRFPKLAPAYEEPSFSSRMVLRGCTEIPVNC